MKADKSSRENLDFLSLHIYFEGIMNVSGSQSVVNRERDAV